MPRASRKPEILQALARMLESNPGGKITTAKLAQEVGLSEAALYRHFPSKAKMIEGLIEFIEDTLFSRMSIIAKEPRTHEAKCHDIALLVLTFVERNPGFARLFVGDALQGETDRLRGRMRQLLHRIETQQRTILRELILETDPLPGNRPTVLARVLMTLVEGLIVQFVRSDFKQSPTADWEASWLIIRIGVFGDVD
ncbi:MAG: nucleoid occlusion factor SlmA [Gammaproteobacteria bacterium]|jgi:TetR/AcrR family transcriptional regulator|nr:nucleoid occlusion factor SlmA [Gammaproteobacteria bacterium]|tara:strand:+ start:2431 stop:3021 length:591 start_codon:yes stop_codon:yes gene_type:complete